MTDSRILFRGRKVMRDWPESLAAAQNEAHYQINGSRHERVRYGDEKEDWGAQLGPCRDCTAIAGEYHVKGCDIERCPICDGQALSCECDYDESD